MARRSGQWLAASMDSPTPVLRRIFHAFLTVAGATLAVKGLALLKDLAVAHRLGVSDALDAFLIAFLLPSLLAVLVGRAAGNAALPVLMAVRGQAGEVVARRLAGAVLLLGGVLLGLVALLLGLGFRQLLPWLASGFPPSKQALTAELLWILLPSLWFGGMSHLTGLLLNARERFALVALAPGLTPALALLALLVWRGGAEVWLLAWATSLGCALEWLLLLGVSLRRRLLGWPDWGESALLRRIGGQFGPLLASNGLVSGTGLVDQVMAAWLVAGSVAALNYGNKLPLLFTTLGSMALGTALLPHFSAMVAAADWTGLRHTARRVMVLSWLATLPLTLVLWLASEPLVALLFQRGEFDAQAVPVVTLTQQLYLLQLPFFFAAMVLNRVVAACGGGGVLASNALLGLVLNALLNWLLMARLGVAGIALSTSLASAVGCGYLAWRLEPLLRARMAED